MAQAAGYAVLPITPSLLGITNELRTQLVGPTQKASKQAASTIRKEMADGADKAAKDVEKANFRVKKSAEELSTAESKLAEQKLKSEAANLAVEAAAKKREQAESKGVDAVAKAEQELLKKRAAAEREARNLASAEQGVEKALSESARAAQSLEDRQEALTKAQEEGEKQSKSLRDRIREVGDEADSATGLFDGLGGKIAGWAGGLAGVMGVGAFAGLGKELSSEIDLINLQLGYTGDQAAGVGESIKDALKSGVAGSAEEAANAIGSIESQWDNLGVAGEQTAGELADNFMAFSKVFDVDIAEATQTAGQLITNGLAADVEDAADLMTTAMQNVPKAMQAELPEIINEYGVNFANLGLSGEEAFGLLVTQAEKGKFALDKTGDSLKEFSIRGSDLSATSVAAFESIGLNAEDMAAKIAAGGDEGRIALEQTAQGLLGMEDPAARANAAIALFGTPMEDLGIDQIPQFLDGLTNLEGGMGDVEGASQALADQMANTLDGRLNTLKGTVQSLASDAFMWVWDVVENDVIPAFKDFGGWVQDNEEWLGTLAAAIGAAVGAWALWTGAIKTWQVATTIATGIQVAFNAVMAANPIMLVAMAIAALAAGLVYFFTQTETGKAAWETFTNALSAGWEWVKTTVFDAWTATTEAFSAGWTATTDAVTGAWTRVKDTFTSVWDWIRDNVFVKFEEVIARVSFWFSEKVWEIQNKWDLLKMAMGVAWDWIRDNVFSKFSETIDRMKTGAETAMDGIGKAFDWLREKTATPINFVIETVYNNGLKKAWDGVAGLVGLDPLPEMKKVAFASGGIMPGYTPGKDVHQFYSPTAGLLELSGGEPVLRPEAGKVLGRSWVDGINASAIRGGVSGVKNFLGAYANGGVIDSITGIVAEKFPGMTITSTYRPGDPGHHGTGNAVDFSDGTDSTPGMRSAAQYFADNYGAGLLELIHSPFNNNIKNGQSVGDGFGFYGAGTMAAHRNHVHVAAGSPLAGGGSGGVLGVLSGAVNFVGDQVKKLWDAAISAIPTFDGSGLIGSLPGAFLTKVGGAAWEWISEKVSSIGAFFGDPGAGVEQWRPLVEKVLTAKGFSTDLADTVLRRMNQESGGNPQAINLWDSNAAAGIPSKGLMQVIDPTFASYADPGFGDVWDPEANIRASMNYAMAQYGSLPAAYNREGGYHNGGLAGVGQGWLKKTAIEPEMVLNPETTQAFLKWMDTSPESARIMAREISEAFNGNDWGYGELASTLGSAEVAEAIVQGAAALGEISREIGPTALDAGRGFLEAQATSLLDVVGLGGLVPLASSMADEYGPTLTQSAQDMFGGISVSGSLGPGGATVIIEAESDEDLVRVGQLKALADHVQGLDVKVNAKKRPLAAAVTRGGVM